MYRKILIANDGSEGARKALLTAIGLAKRLGAELHMVSVEELPRFASSVDEIVEDKKDQNHRFARVHPRGAARGGGGRGQARGPGRRRPRRADHRRARRARGLRPPGRSASWATRPSTTA